MSSELFRPIVVTDELAAATGAGAWLQALLDAEAALAGAQADQGVIPRAAADAISSAAVASRYDVAAIGHAARLGGNPVIPLVDALGREVGGEAAGWVHWGATSQDIMDTAQMLVASRALALVDDATAELAAGCAALAVEHRRTVMVGRTLMQHALPITFGLQAAGWLSGVLDVRQQLDAARDGLAAQLGGAVGTLASLGTEGPGVLERFATRLGLAVPVLPWHTARQRMAALAAALGIAAGTAAKIAGDIALLMQTELGEVAEPAAAGRGGSSALPHKRNPVAAAAVSSAARQAIALVPVVFGSLVAEEQRPVGAWQAEWESLSSLLALAGSAVTMTAETVGGLEVHPAAMAANVDRTGGLVLSERVALALAPMTDGGSPVGRPAAKAAVEEASRSSLSTGRSFGDALADQALVSRLLDPAQIAELLEPSGYLGATDAWIDRVLAAYRARVDDAVAEPVGGGPVGGGPASVVRSGGVA